MKGIVIVVAVAGAVVGGSMYIRSHNLSLPSLPLPNTISVPKIAIGSSSNSGEVLGAQAPLTITHFADRFAGLGAVVTNIANGIGVQTLKTGETLANNVSATPTSSADVIDMSKVVQEVSSKVESIPGNLVNQAKIEYCRQVLQQATASATPK